MRRPSGSLTLGDSRFHERLGKGEEGGFFKLLFGFGIYIYIMVSGKKSKVQVSKKETDIHRPSQTFTNQ